MRGLLSIENLSVLVLDLSDSFPDSPGGQGEGRNICQPPAPSFASFEAFTFACAASVLLF